MADTQTSEWVEHDGKEMPVSGSSLVHVLMKGGWSDACLDPSQADDWVWVWDGGDCPLLSDIVEYRVVKP